MPKILALHGKFQNVEALLARIAEDKEIEGLCLVTIGKDGTYKPVCFNITGSQLAFAALMMQEAALQED